MGPNAEFVARALETLPDGLGQYVESEFARAYGERWPEHVGRGLVSQPDADGATVFTWDAHSILLVMWDHWNEVFRGKLSFTERSLVSELREVRNRWAHQQEFDFDDTYRCLDSVRRLLRAAGVDTADIEARQHALLEAHFLKRQDLETRQAKMVRIRWQSVAVYSVCAAILVTASFTQLGWESWPVAALILLTYGYFSIRALNETRVLFGPHECARCRRIIYTEPCPYCVSPGSSGKRGVGDSPVAGGVGGGSAGSVRPGADSD